MSYQPQSSQPGAFPPQPPPPAQKSNKVLWIVLGLLIGIPTVLGAGCVACVAILGVAGSQQQAGTASSSGTSTASSSGTSSSSSSSGVTLANYNKLQDGMSYSQVTGILGKQGTEVSSNNIMGTKTVMYQWEGDGWASNMNAMFQNGKLISKSQLGLK